MIFGYVLSALAGFAAANPFGWSQIREMGNDDCVGAFAPYFEGTEYGVILVVNSGKASFHINPADNSVYQRTRQRPTPYTLHMLNNELVATPNSDVANDTTLVTINSDGYLTFEGSSTNFYTCKPLAWDPTGEINEKGYIGISYFPGDAPEGCQNHRLWIGQ